MRTVKIEKPLENSEQKLVITREISEFSLEFDIFTALFEQKGDDLLIVFEEENSSILLEGFFGIYPKSTPAFALPNFIIDNELVYGEDFFVALDPSRVPPPGESKTQVTRVSQVTAGVFEDEHLDIPINPLDSFEEDEEDYLQEESISDIILGEDENDVLIGGNEKSFLEDWSAWAQNLDGINEDKSEKPILTSKEFINATETLIAESEAGDILDLTALKTKGYTFTTTENENSIELTILDEDNSEFQTIVLERLKYTQHELDELSQALSSGGSFTIKS